MKAQKAKRIWMCMTSHARVISDGPSYSEANTKRTTKRTADTPHSSRKVVCQPLSSSKIVSKCLCKISTAAGHVYMVSQRAELAHDRASLCVGGGVGGGAGGGRMRMSGESCRGWTSGREAEARSSPRGLRR
eukprot:scaffold11656_cov59-Phaeocystis_antarctica.AAC.2